MGNYKVKKLVVVTGMSGSGKSSMLNILEDQGLFAVDNIPVALLPQLLDLLESHESAVANGVVVVVDVRSRELLGGFVSMASKLKEEMEDFSVVFLDASDDALVQRFNLTKRSHPLGDHLSILEGIIKERALLDPVRELADKVIDSTGLDLKGFRTKVFEGIGSCEAKLSVILSSFGFKHGIPHDSDYVVDVRFLPNPYYSPELRNKTGEDGDVQTYIRDKFEDIDIFLAKLLDLLVFLIPKYKKVGKGNVHITIGCTGGRHRSVSVVEWLKDKLKNDGISVMVRHRDIGMS
ncbi:RNase adapter RapZ [Dethiosulfovibrio salsuginis]|uniref:UPF0042 nucleotide-binding protein n=1 Tax=Dethiosulfovibrio salsuginis TaxID=561720 RepID=A0A1X7I642_9BACT|nr:RNase adapter RapZ [Dethiosulfovibrio salsuginis]SMG09960.1 UPF0042 nucleotide-binding protein [Dethiosulfovibrio salsuginis]